jgi:hypothetical protein
VANTATLMVRILGDASNAQKTMGKFAGTMERAMVPAAAVGAGLIAMGAAAVKSASNLQQAQGAVDAVFGKSAKVVESYAKTSATRLGVSASEYMNSAALMGTALQNAGYSSQQAAKVSDQAWKRAADMAALYGGTGAEAMDAINAAVGRGEFEQLERYGVSLKADSVNALLAAKGQDKLTGSAKRNAQAQAIMAEIMKQSSKAAGQFSRESDTVAVQQQKMAAQIEDSKAAIGTGLLPVVASATGVLAEMAGWAGQNSTTVSALAAVMAGLVVAVFAVNGALKLYQAYTVAAAAASALWNNSTLILRARLIAMAAAARVAAVATNLWSVASKVAAVTTRILGIAIRFMMGPWGLLIAAIVVGAILLVKNWDKVKAAGARVWGWLKNFLAATGRFLKNLFLNFTPVGQIIKNWGRIKSGASSAWGAIKSFISRALGTLKSLFLNFTPVGQVISNWNRIKSSAVSTFNSIVSFIRGIPGKAASAISSLGSRVRGVISGINLFSAGASLISGLTSGIQSKIQSAISAVQSGVSKIKGLLPGSPVKWGPLTAWNNGKAGKRLMSLLASGIEKGAAEVERAAEMAAYGINGGLSIAATATGSPQVNVSVPEAGPTVVEVHLDGQVIGRYVQKKVDASIGSQARRIVLGAVG